MKRVSILLLLVIATIVTSADARLASDGRLVGARKSALKFNKPAGWQRMSKQDRRAARKRWFQGLDKDSQKKIRRKRAKKRMRLLKPEDLKRWKSMSRQEKKQLIKQRRQEWKRLSKEERKTRKKSMRQAKRSMRQSSQQDRSSFSQPAAQQMPSIPKQWGQYVLYN